MAKHNKGITNDSAVDLSAISPMTGGIKAPPTIDIMIYDDARLVWGPRSLTPMAKMVGNMIDIKKKTAISAMTAIIPGYATTTAQSNTLMSAYHMSNFRGAIFFIRAVPAK